MGYFSDKIKAFDAKYKDSHETLNSENREKVRNGEAVIIGGYVFDGYPSEEFIKENRKMFNMDAISKTRHPKHPISFTVWNKERTKLASFFNDGKSASMQLFSIKKLEYSREQWHNLSSYDKKNIAFTGVTLNGNRANFEDWDKEGVIFHAYKSDLISKDKKEILQFLAEN